MMSIVGRPRGGGHAWSMSVLLGDLGELGQCHSLGQQCISVHLLDTEVL